MSIFDDIKGKAEDLISGNEDKIKDGIQKAGDFLDSKTDARFKDQVDGVQNAASGLLDRAAK